MLCASSPLAFQESTCMSFQQENFISQPLSHQSSCHVGQTQTEPPRKSSLVQIFNKEQLSHWASTAGSITLKSSKQHISAIKLRKNIPLLFLNVFVFLVLLKIRNKKVIKGIQHKVQSFKEFGKQCTRKWKLVWFCGTTENFCWFIVITAHHGLPSDIALFQWGSWIKLGICSFQVCIVTHSCALLYWFSLPIN